MPRRDAISAGFGTEYLGGASNEVRIRQPLNKLKGTGASKPPAWLTAHPDTGRYPNHKLVDIQPATESTVDLVYEAVPTTPKIEESIDAEMGPVKKYTYRHKYHAAIPAIGDTKINTLTLTAGDYVFRASENLVGGVMAEVSVVVVTPASSPIRDKTEISNIHGRHVIYDQFVLNSAVTLLAKGATYSGSSIVLNDELADQDGVFGTRRTSTVILANCPLRTSKATDKDYGDVLIYEKFVLSSTALPAIGASYEAGLVLDARLTDDDGTFANLRITALHSATGTAKKGSEIDQIFCVSQVVRRKVPSTTSMSAYARGTYVTVGTAAGYVLEAKLEDDDGTYATLALTLTATNSQTVVEYRLDNETGISFPETKIYTLSATAPTGIGVQTDGSYRETKRLGCNFWVSTTSKTTTLTSESYDVVEPGRWPAVLLWHNITQLVDDNNVVVKYLFDYDLKKAYTGNCRGRVTRTWSRNAPAVDATVTLIPDEIYYAGIFLNFKIPPCLHPSISIFETTGTDHPVYGYAVHSRIFPATNRTTWPASIVQDCNISRYKGGYIKETLLVYAPTT